MNFREFVKYVLIVTVSTIATIGTVIFLLYISMVGLMMSFEQSLDNDTSKAKIFSHSVLELRLDYPVKEKTDDPFENFDFTTFKMKPALTLHQIIEAIDHATYDHRIEALLIHPGVIEAGWASVYEIRQAVKRFKESGKPVLAYSEAFSQKAYYLSSVSDDIFLDQMGFIEWKGLASQIMFYKNLLDRLGIEMQVIRHGKFKSAVEPFVQERMSEENRLQMRTLLFDLWDHILNEVDFGRKSELQRIADELPYATPSEWLKSGFIDAVISDRDEIAEYLEEKTGTVAEDIRIINETDYYYKSKAKKIFEKLKPGEHVAVVIAEGTIVNGEGDKNQIGGDKLARLIRKLKEDDDVKAVVLRINSPGGSALASEIIYRELVKLKEEKPLVVSMGDVAASGGYYIAAPAREIFAAPYTITGSIGVFGLIPDISRMTEDKLHINIDTVKTNPHADMSVFRPLDEIERENLQKTVSFVYDIFLDRVAQGRNMSKSRVDSIGQGRVWSGLRAVELNLADQTGTLQDAIERAAILADLPFGYEVKYYPEIDNPFASLFGLQSADLESSLLSLLWKKLWGMDYEHNFDYLYRKENRIQARLAYEIKMPD